LPNAFVTVRFVALITLGIFGPFYFSMCFGFTQSE